MAGENQRGPSQRGPSQRIDVEGADCSPPPPLPSHCRGGTGPETSLRYPFKVTRGLLYIIAIYAPTIYTAPYSPVHNAFDAGSIHYEGKLEGVVPWKSRLFWAL